LNSKGEEELSNINAGISFSLSQKIEGKNHKLRIIFYVSPPEFDLVGVYDEEGNEKPHFCEMSEVHGLIRKLNVLYKNKLSLKRISKKDLSQRL